MNPGVEAAYRRLRIQDEAQQRMPSMVALVSQFPASPPRSPHFTKIGQASAIKEIEILIAKADGLLNCLNNLHGKSIDSLAKVGFVNERHMLVDLLKTTKKAAQSAKPEFTSESEGRGRNPDLLARGVSLVLAFDYFTLTGKPPTVVTSSHISGHPAGGDFLEFVRAVFSALGIKASAETWARAAVQEWIKRDKEKNPA